MSENIYSQCLGESIDIVAENAVNKSNAAIAIKCTVVSVINPSMGLYTLQYGNNTFNAYSSTGSNARYSVNDTVFVLVPNGDLSKEKTIIGATAPRAAMFETQKLSDLYIPITDNLLPTVNSGEEIHLKSWVDYTSNNLLSEESNFNTLFSEYLDKYRYFLFSARIKTEIDADHQMKGNYGLILTLPFKTAEGENVNRSYYMDVTTMQGNPYNFMVYQDINLYEEADAGLVYDTERQPELVAMVSGFGYSTPPAQSEDKYDIHIKDVSIKMVDVLTERDSQGYYLSVVSDTGNYFLNDDKSKILSPILKLNGVDSKIDGWDCYWFVEDASINYSSQDYLPIGGLGWKCLNKKTNIEKNDEGKETFQYVTNQKTLPVNKSDVTTNLRFKCVLTQDDVLVKGVIRLTNLANNVMVELVSATGSNSFVANVGDVRLIARIKNPNNILSGYTLTTAWQRYDKYDNYIDDNFYKTARSNERVRDWIETEIYYPCSMMDTLNTVNCTIYGSKPVIKEESMGEEYEKVNLGTASIVISAESGFTYGLAIEGGDVVYKYDADGDSPLIANYDGPISSQIKSIDPLSYKIYKADGTELTDTEYKYCKHIWYIPKNSMIVLPDSITPSENDDYYLVYGTGDKKDLNYTISKSFNKKKSDNTIILKVSFDNTELTDSVSPKFLKDGMSGTNGSKYSAVITDQNDYGYGEKNGEGVPQKFHLIYCDNKWYYPNDLSEFQNYTFKIQLFKDGLPFTSGYEVIWRMFDSFKTDPLFHIDTASGLLTRRDGRWDPLINTSCNIIQAEIKITNENSSNNLTDYKEILYCYYPIEITWLQSLQIGEEEEEKVDCIYPSLDGGFEEVLYASDGTNPLYDNTNPFICVDNLYNKEEGLYQYNWEVSNNLKIGDREDLKSPEAPSIKPVTKYISEESKNYVKVTLSTTDEIKAEIQNNINITKQQIQTATTKQGYLNYNELIILNIHNKYNYDDYITLLDNARLLLQCRGECLSYLTDINEALNAIESYCVNKEIPSFEEFRWGTICTKNRGTIKDAKEVFYDMNKSEYYTKIAEQNTNISEISIENLDIIKEILKTKKINLSIINQLSIYIKSYNALINKFNNFYRDNLNGFDADKSIIQNIWTLINNVPTETDLFIGINNLVSGLGIDRLQDIGDSTEYIDLENNLNTIKKRLLDNKTLLTYSDFIINLIDEINSLLSIYLDIEYQTNYFNNKKLEVETQLTNLNIQLKQYQAALLPSNTNYIIHIRPIVMSLNRYEMSNINGWDGNKLYIDAKNEEYLLAPQIGAGQKNNQGQFTGLIMGVKRKPQSTGSSSLQTQIGLFGYNDGLQSLFLNAVDGSATFGLPGSGQIKIIPGTSAIIESGNFNDTDIPSYYEVYKITGDPSQHDPTLYEYNAVTEEYIETTDTEVIPSKQYYQKTKKSGMRIDFSNPEIRFGSGDFIVSNKGEITSTAGYIGNWKIGKNTLESGSGNTGIIIDSNGSIKSRNNNWEIKNDGKAIFKDIEVKTGGTIAGWKVSDSALKSSNEKLILKSSGTICGNEGDAEKWSINSDGTATFSKVTITSANNDGASQIGGVYVGKNGGLQSSNFELGTTGFQFTSNGILNAMGVNLGGTIKASAGNIGGISISGSNSGISGTGWKLTSSGGKIGGWKINGNQLENEEGTVILSVEENSYLKKLIIGGNLTLNGNLVMSGTGGEVTLTKSQLQQLLNLIQ